MDEKTSVGCFVMVVMGFFSLMASVAVGLYVGAWAGFATMAALLFLLFAKTLHNYRKKYGKDKDSNGWK